ncbi:hypothetical protein Syun_000337 [Stephania yunnanensis]|uniref:2-(3-amino-3-carboxypropyl)histidine synthase subunit 1 n=1 Tax=Stephania yunnanensis TaxID=152371 RepID=A0AAP0LDG0_9MAGN
MDSINGDLQPAPKPRPPPKRFIKNQIPDSILNDPALNAAISLLPSNYNLEIHKCVHRIRSSGAKRVALQFPEGLLMYSLVLADIFKTFAHLEDCFVLGDVTYGACCVDDFSASALDADLLIHYGHSCLIPIDFTKVPSLYVFVEIKIDVDRLIDTIRLNFGGTVNKLALAGTIQFSGAIRAAKPRLESEGFEVLVPQSKPLSAGEVLGCTAPTMPKSSAEVVIFVADGRFHLEAFMIANPEIRAFRYDPYIGVLLLEEYDHKGMKEVRKNAIIKSREAKNWGVILGTLGRQGNPRILDRLQSRMRERGLVWTTILMSEISPARVALFGDSIDAWIQIACPRLSIDWGEAFKQPLLTPFEAEIALGFIPGWWEKAAAKANCENGLSCEKGENCCRYGNGGGNAGDGAAATDYPMDYYAQNGGEWNCAYSNKSSQSVRRSNRASTGTAVNS